MAASISCGPAWLMDGPTYDGLILRTNQVAATFFNTGNAAVYAGVLPSGGQLDVSAGSGMSVNVASGYALCPSSSGSTQGGYLFGMMSPGNLTVTTSDPTNPRIDLICAYADDLGDSSSLAYVAILTGTPTAGATLSNLDGAPSIPANGIYLAYLLVPANSTTVSNANILSYRLWTVAQGGILPIWSPTTVPAGYTGLYVHDQDTGRLAHDPAGAMVQPLLLPFPPQTDNGQDVYFNNNTTPLTLCSVTVTTDGNTDVEIHAAWEYVNQDVGPGYGTMQLYIDSTMVWLTFILPSTTGVNTEGGTFIHHTVSGVDRPTAGTHTIKLAYADEVASVGHATLVGPSQIHVRAEPL